MRIHPKHVVYVTVLCASLLVCFRFVLSPGRPLRMMLGLGSHSNRRIRRADGIALGGRGFKFQNLANKLKDQNFRRNNPRLDHFVKSRAAQLAQTGNDPAPAQNKEIKLWEDSRNPNNPRTLSYWEKRKAAGRFHDGFQRRALHSLEGNSPVTENLGQRGVTSAGDVYPSLRGYHDDRIVSQLSFVPESVRRARQEGRKVPVKKLLLMHSKSEWGVKPGSGTFHDKNCTVKDCEIMLRRRAFRQADVVVFDGFKYTNIPRPPGQVWAVYLLESPYTTVTGPGDSNNLAIFNWTASFRHDSTLVTPYEKFVPFDPAVSSLPLTKNYAAGKTKMVAWFVSNCNAANNRLEYARELQKYVQVDIYGFCGTLSCNPAMAGSCFDMLSRDYKFYLSFENANCRDYITEKFFVNGLKNDVLPIAMGAAPDDYRRVAPPHSFLHVDDFDSVKSLAEKLKALDENDAEYNEYFRWKGTGQFMDTKFWCRVCALAHDVDARGPSWYNNAKVWWDNNLDNVCIDKKSWRDVTLKQPIGELPVVNKPGETPDLSQRKVF